MIKKTLLVTISLLIVHALVVMVRPMLSSQYPLQQNTVKAQEFLYNEAKQNIIVGSSLSNRLVMDSLPELYNLSFTGLGVFDGLSILSENKILPKNIFVEMNIIQRERSENFLSYVNSPILNPLKKYLPSLRDGYQPIGILVENLKSGLTGAGSKTQSESSSNSNSLNAETFNRLVNQEIESYSKVLDTTMLTNQFEELRKIVHQFEMNGTTVVFFEMPVNEKLCDLPRPKMIREYFLKYFPASRYSYVSMPDCSEYKTTDGVHLAGQEALKYTKYLRLNIQKLLSKK